VERREPALINDLHNDPRWVKTSVSSMEHRSAIAMPLLVAEDVIGVLMVFHRKPNYYMTWASVIALQASLNSAFIPMNGFAAKQELAEPSN